MTRIDAKRVHSPQITTQAESCIMHCLENKHLEDEDDDFEDDDIRVISGRGEGIMDEKEGTGSGGGRRNEDIGLDLMKFIAMTTSYGKTASSGGVGFTGGGAAAQPEAHAAAWLQA